ncbi:hypothetical protein Q5741_02010 [Paenibacillus sp. JX-17]|uniref:Uncharacterized protein n=1 Tax=Paenibacillus lacisoli TaxID=3064525 RepID=A0ABT9CC55_9BACL|nr:hypothetical protein [Paenibacillus sp. JX-17]MDO7905188.1 hypothetical protein [Paenibacillus sp. JX-17]
MDNRIADHLREIFRSTGLTQINTTIQLERSERGDHDFEKGIGIWAAVASSRGQQLVSDGYVTEEERAAAEEDYRDWIKEEARLQEMYLLAVEGIRA